MVGWLSLLEEKKDKSTLQQQEHHKITRERGSGRVKLLSGRWSREWGGGRIGWEGVGRGAEIVEVRCCNGPIEIRSAWDQGVKWEQCL